MRFAAIVLLLAAIARADVAVDSAGAIFRGKASIEKERITIGRKKLAPDEVNLVEDDEGKLLYAFDFDARLRGYEYLAHEHLRGEYVKLVREAIQVRDFRLARDLLERAEDAGLSSREAGKLKLRIEKEERRKSGKSQVRSRRLTEEARALHGYHGELLAKRAAIAEDAEKMRVLREALRRAPGSVLANRVLKESAPAAFPIGGPRVWLDWHLDLELSGARLTEGDLPAIAKAKKLWRRDLHGVLSDPILVVTPVSDSFMIGRCLAYGRLGCRALADLFQTDQPVRRPEHALTVFLYEDKKEYTTTSGTGREIVNPASLEWTAGHYTPSEGISRFYWFTDPDAERRIVGTCVHELTHHWLEEHNPRVKATRKGLTLPAYWVVEGIATFMEEGIYDIETDTWDHFDPRARSLDCLQSLGHSKKLIPWDRLLTLRQSEFFILPPNNQIQIVMRWQLMPTIVSTRRLFYEQAGAVCQFLYHAEDGKYRQRLIDYVCDYYAGRGSRLDPKKAFGLSAEELGRRTVEFAKAVAGGWQPKGR